MVEPTRWCHSCQQNKPTDGFSDHRDRRGRLCGYRCGDCMKGAKGVKPVAPKRPPKAVKVGRPHSPRFNLDDWNSRGPT